MSKLMLIKSVPFFEQKVVKREVVEGEKAEEAHKRITHASSKVLKNKSDKEPVNETPRTAVPEQTAQPVPSPQTPNTTQPTA